MKLTLKDIESKGNILMSKVNNVVISKIKKKFAFEIITDTRTYYIRTENEALQREWINAINVVSKLHKLKDRYANREYNLSDSCCHNFITLSKRLISLVTRITGITKAIILSAQGKLKFSKVKFVNSEQIYFDNSLLGSTVVDLVKAILEYIEDVYNAQKRELINKACEKFIMACNNMRIHGEGTQNESSLNTNLDQLLETANSICSIPLPTPKLEVLHLIRYLAKQVQVCAESYTSSNNERIEQTRLVTIYANEFKPVIKKVFELITDYTYAKPFLEKGELIPKISSDVVKLVTSSKFFSVAETYATNSVKTLFFLLNQVRELVIAAFPRDEREDEYPQVGPDDVQFKLFEEEFNDIMKEQGHLQNPDHEHETHENENPETDNHSPTDRPSPFTKENYQMNISSSFNENDLSKRKLPTIPSGFNSQPNSVIIEPKLRNTVIISQLDSLLLEHEASSLSSSPSMLNKNSPLNKFKQNSNLIKSDSIESISPPNSISNDEVVDELDALLQFQLNVNE